MIRLLAGGLVAGFVAGLFAAALHFFLVQDLILQSELYETGEEVHFQQAAPQAGHGDAAQVGHDHASHDHDTSDAGALSRNALTWLFAGVIYAGYGLMLAAAYQLARLLGFEVTLARGVLWGLAGFVTFQMAPAMGLAPNLPGTVSADITDRQIWWFGTMVATGAGFALIAYGRSLGLVALAVLLIALPHVIGAPALDTFYGVAPPEIAATFATRVLGIGLAAWVVLGCLTARLTAPQTA